MQDNKATTKAQGGKLNFELIKPVEETIAGEEFLNFVTIGAASNVPKFPNRAKAFDWWTKTLWYDCRAALDTIQVKALRQKLHKGDYLEAKDVMDDAIEFLSLFGTGPDRDLKSIPATSCSQYRTTLQALMEALNHVRVLGLKAEITPASIVYPPASNLVEEPQKRSQKKKSIRIGLLGHLKTGMTIGL